MFDLWETIRELSTAFAPSGREEERAALIHNKTMPYADRVTRDGLGGMTLFKKGNGPAVLLSAPMDDPPLTVTYVDGDGYPRVTPPRALPADALTNAAVRISTGQTGLLRPVADHEGEFFVDFGYPCPPDTALVPGDALVSAEPLRMLGTDGLAGPNSAGLMALAILIRLFCRRDTALPNLTCAFTTQGAVGHRGAAPALFNLSTDIAIFLTHAPADDIPGGKATLKIGGGGVLRPMDGTSICPPALADKIRRVAQEKQLPLQQDFCCDKPGPARGVQTALGGVPTAVLCLPTRYSLGPHELCALSDGQSVEALLQGLLHAVAQS